MEWRYHRKSCYNFLYFLMLLVAWPWQWAWAYVAYLQGKNTNFFFSSGSPRLLYIIFFCNTFCKRNLYDCTSQRVRFFLERGTLTKAEYYVAACWNPSVLTTTQHKRIPSRTAWLRRPLLLFTPMQMLWGKSVSEERRANRVLLSTGP